MGHFGLVATWTYGFIMLGITSSCFYQAVEVRILIKQLLLIPVTQLMALHQIKLIIS
jgi:hypothetical protein